MTVQVIVKDREGKEIWTFEANDSQSLTDLAAMNGIDIPVSCGGGICWVCLCQVEEWGEIVDGNKITTPIHPLADGEILACVAGITETAFTDGLDHQVVIQRVY